MKTKITMSTCTLLLCVILTFELKAQQLQYAKPENTAEQITNGSIPARYTYTVFQAPNKLYGYDIFLKGKVIFHQGASPVQPNSLVAALAKKEHADKAALLAIEKIKKNQPATLTQQEIKKITDQ